MLRQLVVLSVLLSLALSFSCVEGEPPAAVDPLEEAMLPIHGGEIEAGWEPVGALSSLVFGMAYMGSFCSGTLIHPEWVLTAAHCLDTKGAMPVDAQDIVFYMGPDANGHMGYPPNQGELVGVQSYYLHPMYNASDTSHDIGLVHLSEAVTGVDPIPFNTWHFTDDVKGEPVLAVGFGVSDGIQQNGGGVKRSAWLTLMDYFGTGYMSEYDTGGVCFGDSGGPGLLEIEGEWRVVGINSTVASYSGDPCTGTSYQTRVDAYAQWIQEMIGLPETSCIEDPAACHCADACQGDGSCDNAACQSLSCQEIYECDESCGNDQFCSKDCHMAGISSEVEDYMDMIMCMYDDCWQVSGSSQTHCLLGICAGDVEECIPPAQGEGTCEDIVDCAKSCPIYDIECGWDCYGEGDGAAKIAARALYKCYYQKCKGKYGDEFNACTVQYCANSMDVCFPTSGCALTGGDCAEGEACTLTFTGSTDCLPSVEHPVGDACVPGKLDPLDCADGMVCHPVDGAPICSPYCFTVEDCPDGWDCVTGIHTNRPEAGLCYCADGDEDGVCFLADCNDSDALVFPGAEELCDGVDNDCDGITDQGCGGGEEDTTSEPDVASSEDAIGGPDVAADVIGVNPLPGGSGGGCTTGATPTSPFAFLLVFLFVGILGRARLNTHRAL